MDNYRWNAFGEDSGWIHVCSKYLTAKKDEYPNVAHRLYLNTESIDTYKMLSALVEKFEEHQLPYYFKFDQYANRDDTIVIYSNNENLANYIEILQEIQKENFELVERTKAPPALTGKIDNWIGYGSEPEKNANGKNQSFNEVRAKILEASISKVTKQWILTHRDMNINYHGMSMTFEEYMAHKATDIELKKLNVPYEVKSKRETNEDVSRRKGYTLADLQSSQFRQTIYTAIKNNLITKLPLICKSKPSDVRVITMNVRDGKQISLDGYLLDSTIQEVAVEIAKHDKKFLLDIRQEIEENAQQYGIDITKFCFDTRCKDELFLLDTTQEESNQEYSQSKENSSNLKSINSIDIVDYLNPSFMKKKMKLPNGVEIPAIKYIQEVVAPYIPLSGKFILKNGTELSAKRFIEEYVMFKGQEEFNGDIFALLSSTTKANNGIIEIEKPKTPRRQALQQEMGATSKKEEKVQEESKVEEPIEEQEKIKGTAIKKGLTASDVTLDRIEKDTKEIAERKEMSKLIFLGSRATEEQKKRLEELRNIYKVNQNQHRQSNEMGR